MKRDEGFLFQPFHLPMESLYIPFIFLFSESEVAEEGTTWWKTCNRWVDTKLLYKTPFEND